MTVGTRAAVLGSPIAHSLSPVLHMAAYRELGLTGWSYDAIECDTKSLPGLLDSLGLEWAGLSLTMPLKQAVLPLLDEAEQLVTDVGGANTVVLHDGRRAGYNTDVPGMLAALREAGVSLAGEPLVLGAGATACSALAALDRAGATEVTVAVRDVTRAGPVQDVADRLGLRIRVVALAADGLALAGAGQAWRLLISTVPGGAADGVARQVAAGAVTVEAVLDVVYDPWPTLLAQAATAAGATVISGFTLLLHQAARQVELMTGQQAPIAAMRAAGMAEMARRRAT